VSLRRNVLIFHSCSLGDFVLSWPLAMAFGRLFAQSRIFYVTQKQKGLLAEKALRIESVDAESGWHALFAATPDAAAKTLPPTAARLLDSAHAIAGFVADEGSPWAANVRALAPQAQFLPMAAHPPTSFAGHHTDFLLQQLSPMIVWQQGVKQILASIASRGLGVSPAADGPVVIHPGAGSPAKCWPIERFTDLAKRVIAAGRRTCVVIGEVERERMPASSLRQLKEVAELREPQTLVELYDLLKTASAFVGNDSGPGHLAGILGLPTVSLFGATAPATWKPLGPNVKVMQSDPLAELEVESVAAAI
jgi:ADP-heptose:LPS heptosyltransferase